jgi:hypothetical protein
MRWLVALLSLTVICSILGSVGALVLGKPSLKLLRSDRQTVSVDAKPNGSASWPSAHVASGAPGSSVLPAKAAIQ